MLIVLEGIDGAGKTTLRDGLAARLERAGHEVVRTKEPTDGPLGKRIREIAKAGRETVSAEEELAHLRHEVSFLRGAYADEQAARAADAEAVAAERAAWDAERTEHLRQIAVLDHEAGWLRDTYGQMKPPLPGGLVDLSGTSTKRLAKELARRANPARPGFVRRVRRRLPGGR